MRHSWGNRRKDLKTAQYVIDSFLQDDDDITETSIYDVNDFLDSNGHAVHRSNWVVALQEVYERQYGLEEGQAVMNHVLTEIMTKGETAH